jgi:hypothetical protein
MMLLRISCFRCRLASLWTDEPAAFLATICRDRRRCRATLHDERFGTALDGCPRIEDDVQPDSHTFDPAA